MIELATWSASRIQSDESMRFDSIVFWAKFLPCGSRIPAPFLGSNCCFLPQTRQAAGRGEWGGPPLVALPFAAVQPRLHAAAFSLDEMIVHRDKSCWFKNNRSTAV
jgi:hypothetical protein